MIIARTSSILYTLTDVGPLELIAKPKIVAFALCI